MLKKITNFWNAFWSAIKYAYNKTFKESPVQDVQEFKDTTKHNFLAIFVGKLNNLACIESTYDVESDSTLAEPLKELCKDIEDKRFDIVEKMLGEGDLWVFPAHHKDGTLYHRYVDKDYVRILNTDGDNVTDVIGVIDEYLSNDNKTYYLNRRHTLDNGNLIVEVYTTNERNERVYFEPWQEFEGIIQYTNANHIGVGRFKSPTSSRGLSPVYGVPLNFGCEEIEKTIFNDLRIIETEFKRAESKVFADPLVLKKGENAKGDGEYTIPEGIFPIDTRGGTNGANISIFSPAIRYNEYYAKLNNDMQQYEKQVGTDRGFLTPYESGKCVTATEIRRSNASTIALIDKIHNSIENGVNMTLEADAIYLNVSTDFYTVKFDFFDAFEDVDKQYERIANAVDRGIAEADDELQWLFPSLTEEERAEKIERIKAEKQANSDVALQNILMGQ